MTDSPLTQGPVQFMRDGLDLSPSEYSHLLVELSEGIEVDEYSCGGVVEGLEAKMADLLGKEAAVFLPTGTLANQLAVSGHCSGAGRRVLALAESHLVNDAGDGAQSLTGLNLIPLAPGEPTFTAQAVEAELQRCERAKVPLAVGAIALESPVRRLDNRRFDREEIERVCDLARERGIPLHLDGARMFIEAAFSGVPVKETAARFDTVYVSLYKNFHAASGAVLAGSAEFIAPLQDARRMYGGSVPEAWPVAAVALHFADGMVDRLKSAVTIFNVLRQKLGGQGVFDFDPIIDGTNVCPLRLFDVDAAGFQERLSLAGIRVPRPTGPNQTINLRINESLNRTSPEELAGKFIACMQP